MYNIVCITTTKYTIYITTEYFYVLLNVSTFLCHRQGVLHLCLAKLHEFLKLNLLITIQKIIETY